MRILVSNDDGISAKGIEALVRVMSKHAEVVVAAPDSQRSASSHGMSLFQTLYVEKTPFGVPNVEAYAISGTPVDCVKWAISELRDRRGMSFDLMLSGINRGWNLATDVLYSGTVAAAGEACLQHIPAIAVSLAGRRSFDFDRAAQACESFLLKASGLELPADTFLNINLPEGDLAGAKWCATRLGARSYRNEFTAVTDELGRSGYRYAGEILDQISSEDTDLAVIAQNNISVTPLRYHFTNDGFLDSLKGIVI